PVSWQRHHYARRADHGVDDPARSRVAYPQAGAVVAAAQRHAVGAHLDALQPRQHLHVIAGAHHAAPTEGAGAEYRAARHRAGERAAGDLVEVVQVTVAEAGDVAFLGVHVRRADAVAA